MKHTIWVLLILCALPGSAAPMKHEVREHFAKTGLVGVAPGQFVELAAHNDFCSVPAGVRFAAVDAVSGALLGTSMPMQVDPGEGVLIRPLGVTGPSNRMFIHVGARISCPAGKRLGGHEPFVVGDQQPFPAVLELVDAVTKETIRKAQFQTRTDTNGM